MKVTVRASHLAVLALTGGSMLTLVGCWRTPDNIRHVTAADAAQEHPPSLQIKTARPPQAFIITDEATWRQFWGEGEEPPPVDFKRDMVFVACCSLASEGPGTMEVWALKWRQTQDALEVRVKQTTSGEWPQGVGYSRAYDIVRLPQTTKPVRVQWHSVWGTRNDRKAMEAQPWTPDAQTGVAADMWNVQQPGPPTHNAPTSDWGNIVQPR